MFLYETLPLKTPAEMESIIYYMCQSIRELRNCGMCQHWNYHHTSRFLSTPSLGKHRVSSPGVPFSAVFSLVFPRTFNKGLVTSDLTSTLCASVTDLHNDSKVTALGLRDCEKWKTNLQKDMHMQENICTLE